MFTWTFIKISTGKVISLKHGSFGDSCIRITNVVLFYLLYIHVFIGCRQRTLCWHVLSGLSAQPCFPCFNLNPVWCVYVSPILNNVCWDDCSVLVCSTDARPAYDALPFVHTERPGDLRALQGLAPAEQGGLHPVPMAAVRRGVCHADRRQRHAHLLPDPGRRHTL